MAIAFDATSTVDQCAVTSTTLAHTCTGDDRALLVGVNGGPATSLTDSVTYNSVSMTKQVESTVTDSDQNVSLWFLNNPASGANNIVATYSASNSPSVRGISYTGVLGTIPDAFTNNNQLQNVTTITTSVTTVDDNCWTFVFARANQTISAGAGTTMRHAGAFRGADSNAALTHAGSKSLETTTGTSTAYFLHHMISLSPLADPVVARSRPRLLTLMGVGT